MAVEDGSPLSLDAESMRLLGYRTIDMLVDRITGQDGPVVRSATPEELLQRILIPPPEEPVTFDEILAGLEADVLPFVARIESPRLSGLHSRRGDLARCARRSDRERAQRRTHAGGWSLRPECARARGARLVQAVGRLSGAGAGCARFRRLGRKPDRAGMREGDVDRPDERPTRDLHVRPDALVARARGARVLGFRPTKCA